MEICRVPDVYSILKSEDEISEMILHWWGRKNNNMNIFVGVPMNSLVGKKINENIQHFCGFANESPHYKIQA